MPVNLSSVSTDNTVLGVVTQNYHFIDAHGLSPPSSNLSYFRCQITPIPVSLQWFTGIDVLLL